MIYRILIQVNLVWYHGVSRENQRPAASLEQTLSHNVGSSNKGVLIADININLFNEHSYHVRFNICPIAVKTDVGQIDLVLRWSNGTSKKIRDFQTCRYDGHIYHFRGFNISQKPKSSPLWDFTQKTNLNLAPNWYPIICTCPCIKYWVCIKESCFISNLSIIYFV
jgi:hypothetical protein